ncbi:MAG: C10 family peptidase [Prevotella sp.]|nr:C10 family peptidase [Prevotella sp.]
MRKILLFFISLLAIALPTMAQQVSEDEALQEAKKFLGTTQQSSKRKVNAANSLSLAYTSKAADKTNFYVFNENDADGGFVFVAGDKRIAPIIGYAESGSFSENDMPDNMRAWLKGYEMQMKELSNSATDANSNIKRASASKPAIEPLIKAQWSQSDPYNGKCPTVNGKATLTGCVATAMAQVMSLWKFPETLPKLDAYYYYIGTTKYDVPALEEYKMDWSTIKSTYSYSETDDNLAWLMRYCGQSVKMDYNVNTSGASTYNVDRAFSKWGFDPTVRNVLRSYYGVEEWEDLIYKELAANRAVYYSAKSNDVGHAFVCDGYDGNGFFHINWGWSGRSDGYFLLSLLDPKSQGLGGGNSAYTMSQQAVIGISHGQTDKLSPDLHMHAYNEVLNNNIFTCYLNNRDFNTLSFSYGMGYKQDDGTFKRIERTFKVCENLIYMGAITDMSYTVQASDFPGDGFYKVVPLSAIYTGDDFNAETATYHNAFPTYKYIYVEIRNGEIVSCTMAPKENLAVIDTEIEGSKIIGFDHDVKFTIKNNSEDDYIGEAYIIVQAPDGSTHTVNKSKTMLYLRNNESIEITQTVPLNYEWGAGTYNFYLSKLDNDISPNNIIAQISAELAGASADTDFSNVKFTGCVVRGGSPLKVTVKVKNEASAPYPYPVTIKLYAYPPNVGHDECVGIYSVNLDTPLSVGEERSIDMPIKFDFEYDSYIYINGVLYTKPGSPKETTWIAGMQDFRSVKIGSSGWATYASTKSIDFSDCDDLKAYFGKYDSNKKELVLDEKKENIWCETGLVLSGRPNTNYAVKVVSRGGNYDESGNDLVGVTEDTTLEPSTVYVLANRNGNLGFYNYAGTTIKAGHAYLPKTKVGANAPAVNVVFNNANAISDITATDNHSTGYIYNMAGQKVGADYKGIVIINGKKVLKMR